MSELPQINASKPDTITLVESAHQDLRSTGADVKLWVKQRGSQPDIKEITAALGVESDRLSVDNVLHLSEPMGCLVGGGLIAALAGGPALVIATDTILWPAVAVVLWLVAVGVAYLWMRRPEYTTHLSIRCDRSSEVNEIVDRIGSLNHANLTNIQWRYEIDEKLRSEWAETCIARARSRAERVATALGMRIVGVHSYLEHFQLPQQSYTLGPEVDPPVLAAKRRSFSAGGAPSMGSVAIGAPMERAERSGAEVIIEFRVEPL